MQDECSSFLKDKNDYSYEIKSPNYQKIEEIIKPEVYQVKLAKRTVSLTENQEQFLAPAYVYTDY